MIKKGKATEISQRIADILAALRETLGLTQREMADNIGVTIQQYQKYEKGKDRLPLERALVLCAALGIPVDRFSRALDMSTGFAETPQAGFGTQQHDIAHVLTDIAGTVPPSRHAEFLEAVRKTAKMMRTDNP